MWGPTTLLLIIAAASLSNTEDAVAEMTSAEKEAAIAAFDFLEPPTYWKHDGTAWRYAEPSAVELAAYEKSRKGGKTASKKDGSSGDAASKGSSLDTASSSSSSSKTVPVTVGAGARERKDGAGQENWPLPHCSCVSSENLAAKAADPAYAMAKLTPKSVFMVGRNGVVFERFWNEKMWVYVAHRDGEPRVEGLDATISVAVGKKKLFASNKTGHLFERRKLRNALKWLHVSPPAPWQLVGAPLKSPTGASIFAVTKCGELLERVSLRVNATAVAEGETNTAAAAGASDGASGGASDGAGATRAKQRSKKRHLATRIVDRWYTRSRPVGACLAQVVRVWEIRGAHKEKTTSILAVDRDGLLHVLQDTSKSPKVLLREYIANVEQVCGRSIAPCPAFVSSRCALFLCVRAPTAPRPCRSFLSPLHLPPSARPPRAHVAPHVCTEDGIIDGGAVGVSRGAGEDGGSPRQIGFVADRAERRH
jgi:hypothetical protein